MLEGACQMYLGVKTTKSDYHVRNAIFDIGY